uniref:Xylulose kinase-1 n=1 Tax=Tanacetum cinerariifolium TaxID=118510 RepID=A0A699GLI9_TANCI|nr:hypothetical protein [Tanacetum cinerariifolium]
MSTLKFKDVHNLVTFLSKPTESEGFEQIIDFLNANPIKYSLTVNPTIYTSCIEQFWVTAKAKNINEEAHIHAKVTGKKVIISEAKIRRDIKFEDEGGVDCLSNEETQPSDPTNEDLNEENVPVQSNDPPPSRVNTLRSGEDNLKLNELMELCTKLRVKRLEKKNKSRTHGLKRLYKIGLSARVESSIKEPSLGEEDASKQGRNIANIDADAETILVDETTKDQGKINDEEMFDTDVLNDEEVVVVTTVTDATTIVVSIDDITLAQALVEIKTSKPKARGIIIFDEQEARRLQAEIDEQDRLAEEKAQLIEDENLAWDNVQAMIDTDYELAARLQEEDQGEFTIEEKSRLFVELMDKRKKHFAKLRTEEQRRKHPTKAQKRN